MDPTVPILAFGMVILAVALVVMAFKKSEVVFPPDGRDEQIQDLTARLGASADALKKVVDTNILPKP